MHNLIFLKMNTINHFQKMSLLNLQRAYREGAEIFQAFLKTDARTGSGRAGAAAGKTLREPYRDMSADKAGKAAAGRTDPDQLSE